MFKSMKIIWVLALFLSYNVCAQVTIDVVSRTQLCSNGLSGIAATYSHVQAEPTGAQRIPPGDFWSESGAIWVFSTGDEDVYFSNLNFGVGPDGAGAADSSAIKLGPSSKAWTLSVPSSGVSSVDIVWVAGTKVAPTASTAAPAPTTWAAGACTITSFVDKTITCGTKVVAPSGTALTTACACPSSILMELLVQATTATGDPCRLYTNAQNDLILATNACPTNTAGSNRLIKRIERVVEEMVEDIRPRAPNVVNIPAIQPRIPEVTNAAAVIPEKFRRQAVANSGSYLLTIQASVPCSNNPAVFKTPTPTPTAGASPQQASLCINGDISANGAAYSQYGVASYLSSALLSGQQTLAQTGVDVQKLVASAADNPVCSYAAPCSTIACSKVAQATSGATVVVQEWLAYNALANINNFFYYLLDRLTPGADFTLGLSTNFADTFYTNNPPPATWNQIFGAATPILGFMSAALGPFSGLASSALGSISSLFGEAAGQQAAMTQPIQDERVTQASDIEKLGKEYVQKSYPAYVGIYTEYLTQTTAGKLLHGNSGAPLMGPGWLDWTPDSSFADAVLDDFSKSMAFKFVNYLWNASDTFVMYVPYGNVMLTTGKMGNFGSGDCQGMADAFTACDAGGGDGMARLYNANNKNILDTAQPKGATSGYTVGIAKDEAIDPKLIASGSVASWLKGDFGFTLDQLFPNITKGGESVDPASVAGVKISQDQAGFFNLAVCQVKDLRSMPIAKPPGDYKYNMCGCYSKSAVGAVDTSLKFYDKVSTVIKDYVIPGGLQKTIPPDPEYCPKDLYPPLINGGLSG